MPSRDDAYKFTLIEDRLYTKEPVFVKNSRVKIIKKNTPRIALEVATSFDEDCYLLLLHEDNLAHFFHDIFFPLYVAWRMKNKKIFASINDKQFLKDFLIAVFGVENVFFSNRATTYKFLSITPTPESRDLKEYPDYIQI